ncbi:PP2C family serine/threonine-protein phosphatase [Deinococcus sp. NW-56]|uniref:PP2C family serine/threonine-protein phosphatase n=1 Tax=Deinococcus sp. NW-56 TaxID=2080419 RepID=UPI001319D7D7|nr:PP2C family serine/threonine-protein phosphatase [Deinococcus sp. NW-56]
MSAWRYIHASAMGTAHVGTGQPCQDSQAVKVVTNGQDEPLLLLVTSDGAGSAQHSHEGSREVCEETLRWLQHRLSDGAQFLDGGDGLALVRALRLVLQNYAEDPEREYALRDLACTLNVAAVLPDRAWFLQVGDGATVIQQATTPLEVVFWPDNGEYANQTYFITDAPDDHIHTRVLEGAVDRVALMTDGLQTLALALQQRAPHVPFFEPLLQAVEALDGVGTENHGHLQAGLARFLDSPGVNARTSDDKTLILCSRRERPAPGGEATPEEPEVTEVEEAVGEPV